MSASMNFHFSTALEVLGGSFDSAQDAQDLRPNNKQICLPGKDKIGREEFNVIDWKHNFPPVSDC